MTRREILSAFSATAGLGVAGCQTASTVQAPDFSGADSSGNLVRLSDHAGKVVLVDFWMTTCVPCKIEIPWLVELAEAYRDRGFLVIGVSLGGESWDVVRPFLRERGVHYPVLLGDDELADRYHVMVLPTTLLLDREGRIERVHEGLVDKELLRREIEALLG